MTSARAILALFQLIVLIAIGYALFRPQAPARRTEGRSRWLIIATGPALMLLAVVGTAIDRGVTEVLFVAVLLIGVVGALIRGRSRR